MSYLFEFDKDYHSSSDSDYNPDMNSDHSTESDYESDCESECEWPNTPVKEKTNKMPQAPVKKRPIKMPLDSTNSKVRPIKMTFNCGDSNRAESVNQKDARRPVRERKQPIRYQA